MPTTSRTNTIKTNAGGYNWVAWDGPNGGKLPLCSFRLTLKNVDATSFTVWGVPMQGSTERHAHVDVKKSEITWKHDRPNYDWKRFKVDIQGPKQTNIEYTLSMTPL